MTELTDTNHSELDRRGFLKCMAWAGTAVTWTVSGGVLSACEIGANPAQAPKPRSKDLYFVQISDSHIGFKGTANADVTATFGQAISQVNALAQRPAFVMNTGDLTHTSTAAQFDTVKQLAGTLKTAHVFQVPGEHDVIGGAQAYLDRYGKSTVGTGYYSFDMNGVHFLALVNVNQTEQMGHLGQEQLDWIKKDLSGLASDTPIVVFAHVPLFAMYPQWGWSTDDAVQALGFMKRFGSVSCLNGHVHQVMTKVEGNVTFHTARGTAFPLPAPGTAPAPTPVTVPAGQLHQALGVSEVRWTARYSRLAIVDDTLPT
ncbi:MAG: metallophosphoesterase [Candidatus Dormibacteraeota bacterium]|uniref:Metallophosphoesterase n=1 Tax=Candidatus Dormiibacter inghamiae TaxID=3127013 RepID=A0A934KK32_9BACT|nr:metallophosphoesterase [Candidatus Dormibacteraeota bacterium]MBJ7606344.1 metallophosphoesterase [Candidatus Dormibacteraeota bacterium]